jgi:hypothetical protein
MDGMRAKKAKALKKMAEMLRGARSAENMTIGSIYKQVKRLYRDGKIK